MNRQVHNSLWYYSGFWMLLGMLVLACTISGCADASTPTQPSAGTPTAIVTIQRSLTPTLRIAHTPISSPTVRSIPITATHGMPHLGGPLSDFVGKYGPPDTTCAACTGGFYNFQRYQGTQIDYISTVSTDAHGNVNGFDVQAAPNIGWDTQAATALCDSFGPPDVTYDHPIRIMPATDGMSVEKVYKSASLAEQLTNDNFQDDNTMNGNTNLPPGTFDIFYTYDGNQSRVSDCSLSAGIQRQF